MADLHNRITMIIEGNTITADEGKVFRRIADGMVYGDSITLGYSYYIGGVFQDPPHQDTPEDFEEVYPQEEVSDTDALNIITGRQ